MTEYIRALRTAHSALIGAADAYRASVDEECPPDVAMMIVMSEIFLDLALAMEDKADRSQHTMLGRFLHILVSTFDEEREKRDVGYAPVRD